jgi:hypothetical protein
MVEGRRLPIDDVKDELKCLHEDMHDIKGNHLPHIRDDIKGLQEDCIDLKKDNTEIKGKVNFLHGKISVMSPLIYGIVVGIIVLIIGTVIGILLGLN